MLHTMCIVHAGTHCDRHTHHYDSSCKWQLAAGGNQHELFVYTSYDVHFAVLVLFTRHVLLCGTSAEMDFDTSIDDT